MDYIVFAIPVFFLLIGLEVLISYLKKSKLYGFSDSVTNISCGITQQVIGVLFKAVLILFYWYIYNHWRLFEMPNTVIVWVTLFVAIDFFYYWFHRTVHEVNIFWGTHIVHHQSEEYNLTVALRQSIFQSFISTFFYLPLALMGFHPATFLMLNSFQTLYQFWIHTKLIDKMPSWFEFFLNTPSHHRVHHGRNPKYIDKNHGGTLIIFDRMFGTFQLEEETVVYGVTKNLNSWNPLWANFDYYRDVLLDLKHMPTWKDRFLLLINKPGWQPDSMGGPRKVPIIENQTIVKYNPINSVPVNYYVIINYVVILLFGSLFLFNANDLSLLHRIIGISIIVCSVTIIGGILESKIWAKWAEILRLILFVLLIIFMIHNWSVKGGLIVLIGMTMVCFNSIYKVGNASRDNRAS